MTITIKKLHLAIAVLVVALIAPATAFATHIFDDVPDDAFFADAVEWAAANDVTKGRSPDLFDPWAGVTRGESVTFLNRYDTNIVQPALDALVTPVAVAYVDHNGGNPTVTGTQGVTATWDGVTGRYTVSVADATLSATTHAVHVMSIRINSGPATQDRSAQTYFSSGSVQVGVWDASAGVTLANSFHISIYALPT